MLSKIKANQFLPLAVRIFFFAVLVLILSYVISRRTFFITSDQAFINTKLVTLRAPITGVLHAYDIPIGEAIEVGEPLWEIANPQFGNTDTYTNYQNLQNQMDILKNEIEQQTITIKKLDNDHEKFLRLKEAGAIAKKDIEEVEKNLSVTKVDVANKKDQWQRLQNRYQEIQLQLDLQKKSVIRAPCAGVLWTILAKEGEQLNYGAEIGQMINPQDLWVDAFFNERYATQLSPGMMVKVEVLGTHRSWDGEIVFVRGGSGRILYNSAVEMPPTGVSGRLVAVRVKVNWRDGYKPSEFYGVGRSLVVIIERLKNNHTLIPQKHG